MSICIFVCLRLNYINGDNADLFNEKKNLSLVSHKDMILEDSQCMELPIQKY